MNKLWIEWQLKNAGAERVEFADARPPGHVVRVGIGEWAAATRYTTDREAVITLTRAIRERNQES